MNANQSTQDIEALLGIDREDPVQREALEQMDRDRAMLAELTDMRGDTSQETIARRMGTHQSTVARIESGARDIRMSTLRSYALAVGARLIYEVQPIDGPAAGRAWPQHPPQGRPVTAVQTTAPDHSNRRSARAQWASWMVSA